MKNMDQARVPGESKTEPAELLWTFQKAKKCGAKTRSGGNCKNPAMKNGRCRLHGGKSTGAPKGNKNAFKHGRYSREAIEARQFVRELIRMSRQMILETTGHS
ncbi:HGGxSTG domain-containing protein [Desulforhabdus sp. TSK]|uniref:HGGxSTG domain-containing protein n=1 Tax=Desulforhabdus sp. TSK TaxID=2925014 RepID=UPI0034D3D81D